MAGSTRPRRPLTVVVGGGVAGIAAVKALAQAGVPVFGVERDSELGGLWRLGEGTAAYEGLRLNTSKARTEFRDHPMPTEWPDYPTRAQMLEYLQGYADHFGVTEKYRLDTTLESARRRDGRWHLVLVGPEGRDGRCEETADHLVVANGHNREPHLVEAEYPGTFDGEQSHAHSYLRPDSFAGKRVLVVGTGNSAMDIAAELVDHAGTVLLSARRGVWILPKTLMGRPSDQVNGALAAAMPWRVRQRVSEAVLRLAVPRLAGPALPKPSTGVLQDHPTLSDLVPALVAEGRIQARPGVERLDGSRVRYVDGRADEVDHIIWCTGYLAGTPFLDDAEEPSSLLLYRHVFPPGDPSLSYVGLMQSTGSALPVVEAQGRLVAAHLTGTYEVPAEPVARRIATQELEAARERWGERRPHMRIDVDQYLRTVEKDLRAASRGLAGRRILITGAAGTFGTAMASRFSAAGAAVVGLDLVDSNGAGIPIITCDVTSQEAVDLAVKDAVDLLGGLDVLVNNAGRGGPAPAEQAPEEEVEAQLQLNLLGSWRVTAATLPHLLRQRGQVVFIASRMAVLPLPLAAAYGVSKRALAAYADALRLEVGSHVSVTTVYPSMVNSPIHDSTARAGLSLDGVSRPEPVDGVVDAVVKAVTSSKAPRDLATTRRGALEMGLARHFPALADRLVTRTLAKRISAGDLDRAALAQGMVRRHRSR